MPPLFPPYAPIPSTSRLPLPSPSHPHPHRSFHSTRPTHRPHILHPTTRLRLTNLTFYLCAIVSITTVSLTMSGSIGNGSVVGCPVRPAGGRVGVGAEEDTRMKEKGKGKSRWLEDPVPIGRREEEVLRPGKNGRLTLEKKEQEEEETRRIGGNLREEDSAIGWRSWVGRGANTRMRDSTEGEKEKERTGFAEGQGRIV